MVGGPFAGSTFLEAALVIQAETDMSIEKIGLAFIVLVDAMAVAACIVAVLGQRGKTILLLRSRWRWGSLGM